MIALASQITRNKIILAKELLTQGFMVLQFQCQSWQRCGFEAASVDVQALHA